MSLDLYFSHGLDLANRTIYIGSAENQHEDDPGTNFQMAEKAIKGLSVLDRTEGDITIILNNYGGDVNHGLAIYDAIKGCRNRTVCKVYGMAMSMGGIILQAADVRLVAPNAVFMLHTGTDSYADNHPKNIHAWVEEGKRVDKWAAEMFAENTGLPIETINEMLIFDTILPALETVELGFADNITTRLTSFERPVKRKR